MNDITSKPLIDIAQKDWDKLMAYANSANNSLNGAEIGGMAVCLFEEGRWIIADPVILKQEVSSGNCDLDQDALSEYYAEAGADYKDYLPNDLVFLWWHSHNTMSAFWSATDIQTIEESFDNGDCIALVINVKGEYKLQFNLNIEENSTYGKLCSQNNYKLKIDCELNVLSHQYDFGDIDGEVKELCSPYVYQSKYNHSKIYNRYTPKQEIIHLPSTLESNRGPSDYNSELYNVNNQNDDSLDFLRDDINTHGMKTEHIMKTEHVMKIINQKQSEHINAGLDIECLLYDYNCNKDITFKSVQKGFKEINDYYGKFGIKYKIPKKVKEIENIHDEKVFRIFN